MSQAGPVAAAGREKARVPHLHLSPGSTAHLEKQKLLVGSEQTCRYVGKLAVLCGNVGFQW